MLEAFEKLAFDHDKSVVQQFSDGDGRSSESSNDCYSDFQGLRRAKLNQFDKMKVEKKREYLVNRKDTRNS